MLAIHGRTRADKYEGAAEYDTIAAIKQAVNIPVIANGDIDCAEKALSVLQHTGCDGIMLGRAAHGRPWIFREIRHYLSTQLTTSASKSARACRCDLSACVRFT
jgi:tRNA-dihydrouridine synthase B